MFPTHTLMFSLRTLLLSELLQPHNSPSECCSRFSCAVLFQLLQPAERQDACFVMGAL